MHSAPASKPGALRVVTQILHRADTRSGKNPGGSAGSMLLSPRRRMQSRESHRRGGEYSDSADQSSLECCLFWIQVSNSLA